MLHSGKAWLYSVHVLNKFNEVELKSQGPDSLVEEISQQQAFWLWHGYYIMLWSGLQWGLDKE